MYTEQEILENRAEVLRKGIPKNKPVKRTKRELAKMRRDFIESMKTFDKRAYLIYDVVQDVIHLSDCKKDNGQHLGLFVVGKF